MRFLASLLLGATLSAPALANDSTAELTTGGLVLTHSANIEMRSEELSISPRDIVVRYRFFNRGSADETVTVAFPMPDIVWDGPDANIAIPAPEAANFLAFSTVVDGAPVKTRLEQKAFAGAADITARLQALGLPLAPQTQAARTALDALARPQQDELIQADIAVPDDYDVGKGMEHHVTPRWTLKTSYFWSQTFPAGREVAIEHRYTPSVGETAGAPLQMLPVPPEDWRRYQPRYCLDDAFLAGVQAASGKRDAEGGPQFNLFEKRISYVLTTGANWAGPIGDFHLTIDKGSPANLVSFCAEGVKKTSPTSFEVRRRNFTPTRNLDILILYRQPT